MIRVFSGRGTTEPLRSYSLCSILSDERMGLSHIKSKSKLLHDLWFNANQFVLASRPSRFNTRDFFFNLTLEVTSSLMRRRVCLLCTCLAFRQVYVMHMYHVIQNSSFCTVYKPSSSTGIAKQIMPTLCIASASYK
jgi:hypothetical protein